MPDYIGAVRTANAGLDKAVANLEPLKANYPGVSYADLYTLAGVAAIQALRGPVIKWFSFTYLPPLKGQMPPLGAYFEYLECLLPRFVPH